MTFLLGVSPWPFLGRSTRGGGGHGFQIGDDRVDLGAREVMLEGGHARRALADEAADDLIAAAGRVLGQEGAVGSRVDLRRQVANPAGLGENLAAQFLRGGQVLVGAGLLRPRTPRRQHAQESGRANRGAALHLGYLPTFAFLQAYAGAAPSGRLDPERGGLTGMRSRRGAAETTVDRACVGDWRGYAVHRLRRRAMRLGGSNNRSRWGGQMLPRLAFACMTAMAIASNLSFAQ